MLIEGGLIPKAFSKIIDMFLLNLRLLKAGGTAAGQTLTKAIPVVFAFHRALPVLTSAITSPWLSLRRAKTSIQSAYSVPVL